MLPTLSTTQVIYLFQIVQFVILFCQYIPQMLKTYKRKTVGDISVIHWISKLAYSILAMLTLILAHNDLIIVLSQIINLVFCILILWQLYYYSHKADKEC